MHRIYTREDLDALSERIHKDYDGGKTLRRERPLDIEAFAELYLDARIDFKYLSQDGDVPGMSALSDGQVEVWDESRSRVDLVFTRAKTIFLDIDSMRREPKTRQRFTLAHECAHIILHQPLEKDFAQTQEALVMRFDPHYHERPIAEDLDPDSEERWREWQADHLGGCLLMPGSAVRSAWSELLPNEGKEEMDVEGCIAFIAVQFGVSSQAAEVRLNRLGLI